LDSSQSTILSLYSSTLLCENQVHTSSSS